MADWTIRVAQLPIGFGTPYKHNMIVVMDSAGRVVYELNGGPVGSDGNIVPLNDRRGPFAYLSGEFPVGAERHRGTYFYRPDLNQRVVFSGPEDQVLNRVQAAEACIRAINSAQEKYTLFTGPSGGRDAPSSPTFNSNSVNASLLQCMGIPVDDPAITRQPGFENPILNQDQVQQIIEQQNSTAPPPGNVPLPRPRPDKRGDAADDSYGLALGRARPAAPTMLQAEPGPAADADLPQHVIDAGNYLRANGIEITPRSMYVASVLGPQRAVDLFNRTGSTSSDEVPSPDAATGRQVLSWVRALRLGPAAAGAPTAPNFEQSAAPFPAAQAFWGNVGEVPQDNVSENAGLPMYGAA
jgi:hypothetical protein